VPSGRLKDCYTVMPFGLKNAWGYATYNKGSFTTLSNAMSMISSSKQNGGLTTCRRSLIDGGNIKMNPLKCAFGVTSGKFLGFSVRHRGMEINPTKIRAILEMTSEEDPRVEKPTEETCLYPKVYILPRGEVSAILQTHEERSTL
jgi:hypothetical protein